MTFLLILKSDTDSAELVSKNQHKDITLKDVACELWLHELSYQKKIFQPGMVLAKLQLKRKEYPVDQKNIGIPTEDIVNYFKDNVLKVTRDGKDVATDYYIYKVLPEFRRDSDANQYVELTCYCYSRDHKLTLHPYSKMYVNKKLVGDLSKSGKDGIIQTEMDGILKKAGFDDKTIDCGSLRFLKYITKPEKKDEKGNVVQKEERKEFIQPYLVQYNESFYDFLARTANRCGEFMYHDQGILHIGLPVTPSDKVRTIDEQKVYAYRYQSYGESIIEPSPVYVDSMGLGDSQKGKGQFASGDGYFYYDELPIDEYLGLVLTKDKFANFADEFFGRTRAHIEAFSNFLTQPTYGAVLGAIAGAEVTNAAICYAAVDNKNSDGNKLYIKPATDEHKDGDTVRVYGSMLNNEVQGYNYDHAQNLNSKFYQFVNKCSHNIAKTLIEVETGVDMPAYGLGEEVVFNNQNCIVIGVEEALMSDHTEEVARGQRLLLEPLYSAPVKGSDTNLSLYCPPPTVPFAREVGVQRAFVAKNGDPQGLGRVCIRYPWQQAGDEPSPWVRMAMPFAPNNPPVGGAGMFFEPEVGDEVVVDYENGNIEHPIITGSLYSPRNAAPSSTPRETLSLKTGRERRISSEKGHSLIFTDSDMASHFLTSFWPGYKTLTSVVGMFGPDLHFGENDPVSGGVTLCDAWGLYRISASSTDRNITIMSPFGDIMLNAYTGITISAPNGEVKIAGKNVTIEAGNELKLVSGKNIDDKWDASSLAEKAGYAALATVADGIIGSLVAPLSDISLVRTVFETFLRPVAGTMTVHSGRYLLLNAGSTHTEIPNKGLNIKGLKNKEGDHAETIKLRDTLAFIDTSVKTLLKDYIKNYNKAGGSLKELTDNQYFANVTSPTREQIIQRAYEGNRITKDDFKYTGQALAVYEDIFLDINIFIGQVKELSKICENFVAGETLGNASEGRSYFSKEMKSVLKNVKSDLPDYIQAILNKTEDFSIEKKSDIFLLGDGTYLTRLLAVKLIENTKILDRDPVEKIQSPKMFMSSSDYLNEDKWNDYIDQLVPYDFESYASLTSWESIQKWFSALFPNTKRVLQNNVWDGKWYSDRNIWDYSKNGEILMTDKNGKETISIVNGAITRTPNQDGYIEQTKDIMRSL